MTATPEYLLFRIVPLSADVFTYECGPFLNKDGSSWTPGDAAPYIAPYQSGVRLHRALPEEIVLDPAGPLQIVALAPKTPLPKDFAVVAVTEDLFFLTYVGKGRLEMVYDGHGCRAPVLDDLPWGLCEARCSVQKMDAL